jgi:acetolactate synthase-1/2/3 large subunit
VTTVFALPGVQIMAAFDALHEVRDDIRLIHVRHEQATTYMAHGYSRVTGRVGVAMVVPGPGALNAAAGLGTAYACSSPVLLISGQIRSDALGKGQGQLHEVEDQLDVFKPITKWNSRVTRAEEIPEAVHEAMRQLNTGRPRPVELEIPPDTLAATGDMEILPSQEYTRSTAKPSDIQEAVRLLDEARKPLIIAGGGTLLADASQELMELAELIQAPVMTTPQAKGIIPEDHPLAVGAHYALVGPSKHVVPESDVILAVGTRLLVRDAEIKNSQKVIHIDADGGVLGKNQKTTIGIEADAREALSQLLHELQAVSSPRPSRREEIAGYRRAFMEELRELAPQQVDIIGTLRKRLDQDAIVVAGITNIGNWSHLAYPVSQPRTYVTSSYFGTLGYAFPTALGAKVARPQQQVVALCGDGGFMYNVQELSTAVQHGIHVLALVFNNNAYGASEWDQTHRYNSHYIGTDLHNPDFVQLAESFGAVGMRTEPEGLDASLQEALAVNAPVVLEVMLPNLMPPFHLV